MTPDAARRSPRRLRRDARCSSHGFVSRRCWSAHLPSYLPRQEGAVTGITLLPRNMSSTLRPHLGRSRRIPLYVCIVHTRGWRRAGNRTRRRELARVRLNNVALAKRPIRLLQKPCRCRMSRIDTWVQRLVDSAPIVRMRTAWKAAEQHAPIVITDGLRLLAGWLV